MKNPKEFVMRKPAFVLFAAVALMFSLTACGWYNWDNPADGDTSDGDAVDGDASDGDILDGDAPDGDEIDGDAPDGDLLDGDETDGDEIDGDAPDGDVVDGDETDGDLLDGDEPDGDEIDGDAPDGDVVDGDLEVDEEPPSPLEDLDHDGVCDLETCSVFERDTCPTVWNPDNDEAICPEWADLSADFGARREVNLSEDGADSTWRRTHEPVEVPLANGILDDSVVGYWKLDNGEARDYSGRGNDGVLSDPAPTSGEGAFGDTEGAMVFDGTDDYVDTGFVPQWELNDSFSVSAWAKLATGAEGRFTVTGFEERLHSAFYLYWDNNFSGKYEIVAGIQDNVGNFAHAKMDTGAIEPTVWHHIVAVRNVMSDKLCIYVDAILAQCVGDITTSTINETYERSVFIGAENHSNGLTHEYMRYFKGSIDEVLIFNRALSPGEIKAYYDSRAPYSTQAVPGAQADFDDVQVTELSNQVDGADFEHAIPSEIIGVRPHSDTPCPSEYASISAGAIPHIADREDLCGVVGYWKLDGNGEDSSGNGLSATLLGSPEAIKGRYGERAGAVYCDANQCINIEETGLMYFRTFTVELWTNVTKDSTSRGLIAKGLSTDKDRNFDINRPDDFSARCVYNDTNGNMIECLTPPNLVPNQVWTHIACSLSLDSLDVYVNGINRAHCSTSAEPASSERPIVMGSCGSSKTIHDDVLIHAVAKSPEYIYRRANPGLPTVRFLASTEPEDSSGGADGPFAWMRYFLNWSHSDAEQRLPILTGLDGEAYYGLLSPALGYAGWWRFNEGAGTLAVDSSTNKHNGKFEGGVTWGTGLEGAAAVLDGVDGFISLPSAALDGAGDFSFESAFIHEGDQSTPTLLSAANDTQFNEVSIHYGSKALVYINGVNGFSGLYPFTPFYFDWRIPALTRKDTMVGFYQQWEMSGMDSYNSAPLNVSDGGLILGFDQDCLGGCQETYQRVQGPVDSVRIMSRALEPDEFLHYPLASWDFGDLTEQDGATPLDNDDDGVPDDGDGSLACGDNACLGPEDSDCDDNCPFTSNPQQDDSNANGIGDLCENWVSIKAGTFWMGSPDGVTCPEGYPGDCTEELGRGTDEALHYVELTYDFEMMAKEVTQGEFTAFAGTNPSWFGPNADGVDCGTNCPVERVNWYDALDYANWLSEQAGLEHCYVLSGCTGTLGGGCAASESSCSSGTYACMVALNGVSKPQDCQGFRLPTEAEWEYAIRAGTTTGFYNGEITNVNQDPKMDLIGWYYYNSDTGLGRMAHPVGQMAANARGLYDMSGNAWEWTWDRYQAAYQSDVAADPVGPATGSHRVLRGGSWNNNVQNCRSAHRVNGSPGNRNDGVGFRLVRTDKRGSGQLQ
jgi:formylglycine-generating enzyme required for sulfatase activity